MKQILKRIDGKLIKVRPQPSLTNKSPLDMPFIDQFISTHPRAKNTATQVFTSNKCPNSVFIADCTPHVNAWSWYLATICNANPILQSTL